MCASSASACESSEQEGNTVCIAVQRANVRAQGSHLNQEIKIATRMVVVGTIIDPTIKKVALPEYRHADAPSSIEKKIQMI